MRCEYEIAEDTNAPGHQTTFAGKLCTDSCQTCVCRGVKQLIKFYGNAGLHNRRALVMGAAAINAMRCICSMRNNGRKRVAYVFLAKMLHRPLMLMSPSTSWPDCGNCFAAFLPLVDWARAV